MILESERDADFKPLQKKLKANHPPRSRQGESTLSDMVEYADLINPEAVCHHASRVLKTRRISF